MARPRKQIDPEQVEKLAAINCSYEEAASVLKCSPDTIQRRFAAVFKKGRANGRSSLKRKMWEHAMSGNTTMMIWLSKQMLGYTDKVEERTKLDSNHTQVIQIKWADEDDSAYAQTNSTAKENQSIN